MKTRSTKLSTIFNLLGSILPIAVTLVTIPIYIREIGESRFGILSIVWLILGFFGLFDLGLSRATTNKLSEIPPDAVSERVKVFWTALYVNFGLGIVGGLILFSSAHLIFTHVISVSGELQAELIAAIPWIALGIPLVTVTDVLVGTLDAHGEFLIANSLQLMGSVFFQVFPLVAASYYSTNLSVLIGVAVFSRALTALSLGVISKRLLIPGRIRGIDFQYLKSLLKYGLWITVTNAISPILVSADQFLIASFLGTSAVAPYSIAFSAVGKLTIFPTAIGRSLFPQLSRLQTSQQAQEISNSFLYVVAIFMALTCSCGILLAQPLLTIWLNNPISITCSKIAEILLVGIWFNSCAVAPLALLQGQRRPDIVAKFHAAEILPFLTILFFFVREFGVLGAACAWVLRVMLDELLLLSAAGYKTKQIVSLLPGLFIIGVSITAINLDAGDSLAARLIMLLFSTLFCMAWVLIAPTPLRSKFRSLASGNGLFFWRGKARV